MKSLYELSLCILLKQHQNIDKSLLINLSKDEIISIFISFDLNDFFNTLDEINFDSMIFKIYLYFYQYINELKSFQSKNIQISNNFNIMTNIFIKIIQIFKKIDNKEQKTNSIIFSIHYLKLFFNLFFHHNCMYYENRDIIRLFLQFKIIKYLENIKILTENFNDNLFQSNEIMMLPIHNEEYIKSDLECIGSHYFDPFCVWNHNIKLPSDLNKILNLIHKNQNKLNILAILCKIKIKIIEFYSIEKNILLYARRNFQYNEKYISIIKIFLRLINYYVHHQNDKNLNEDDWYKYFINIVNIFSWKYGYGASSSNNLLSHMNWRNRESDRKFIHQTIISFEKHMNAILNIYSSKNKPNAFKLFEEIIDKNYEEKRKFNLYK